MSALPEVLAGPIVRRVEPQICSFWIALSHPASVQASIWRGIQTAGAAPGTVASGEPEVAGAITTTLAVGRRLHVAVVTIKLAPSESLQPGQVHSYDIQVVTQSERKGLRQLRLLENETAATFPELPPDRPMGVALGYVENRLPSFVTPPPLLEQLRLAHGSCRKSTSPTRDALAWLDDHIKLQQTTAERPHQLFLTGDQIYADDFSSSLLVMLGDLAQDLMGARERLHVTASRPQTETAGALQVDADFDADLHNFPAARRQNVVWELGGYTTDDGESHLLSFGEYAAMYVAVWSPRVWRALGKAEQILNAPDPDFPELQPFWSGPKEPAAVSKWLDDARKPDSGFARGVADTLEFRSSVPRVARALANVATYMIFDDHDVTDDWNLHKKWLNRVNTRAFGRQIVRNAVTSYAVFQGWGNDPVAFEGGKGAELLSEIKRMHGAEDPPGTDPIPRAPTTRADTLCGLTGADFKEQAVWSYTVGSPKAQVLVLDTRTRRKFTGEGYRPPDLIGLDRETQIPKGPLTDGRELLLIVSATPVLVPEMIDSLGWPLAQVLVDAVHRGKGLEATRTRTNDIGVEKYDAEGWSSNDLAREELLKRVAPYERVVFLSGDVHFAYSQTMDYYRKGVAKPARLVQLTSSPLRNRFKPVVKLLSRQNAFLQTTEVGFSADRLAWEGAATIDVPPGKLVSPGRRGRMQRSPALLPATGWPDGTKIRPGTTPDWSWRLELVRDQRPDGVLPEALRQPVLAATQELVEPTPSDPDAALAAYRTVAARHQKAAADRFEFLRQMIFQTNIGLVAFSRDALGKVTLRHTLLSQAGPKSVASAEGTVHVIALEPSAEPPPKLEALDPEPPEDA